VPDAAIERRTDEAAAASWEAVLADPARTDLALTLWQREQRVVPGIRILGRDARAEHALQAREAALKRLQEWLPKLRARESVTAPT
jgi:hypothetical protein